jgi:hypothetical protein
MHNYTGFAHLHIGGQERPFYYGVAAAEIYCQREKIEFHEFQEAIKVAFGYEEKDSEGNVTKVPFNPIYAGKFVTACLLAGYEYVEQEPDFSPSRVKFWLQEFTPATWKAVFDVVLGANVSPNESAPIAEQAK